MTECMENLYILDLELFWEGEKGNANIAFNLLLDSTVLD